MYVSTIYNEISTAKLKRNFKNYIINLIDEHSNLSESSVIKANVLI